MSIAPQKWVSNLVNQANAHTHTHTYLTCHQAPFCTVVPGADPSVCGLGLTNPSPVSSL